MEPEEKQVRNCIYNFVQTWWPWLLDIGVVVFFVAFLFALVGCRSSKVVSDRETRDSVVYIYKTHYLDSLRVRDSTVVVYERVQRDSVVLKVDKATGEVISKDTWHWKDTSKDRDHVSEVRKKTEKSDSEDLKTKGSVVVSKMETTANLPTKTHYTRVFLIGVCLGVLLSVAVRYRKKIFDIFAKMC